MVTEFNPTQKGFFLHCPLEWITQGLGLYLEISAGGVGGGRKSTFVDVMDARRAEILVGFAGESENATRRRAELFMRGIAFERFRAVRESPCAEGQAESARAMSNKHDKPKKYLYEVVDETSGETYWTQGFFETLEEAIQYCDDWDRSGDPPNAESPETDDLLVLSIRKRPIGHGSDYDEVWTKTWRKTYRDEGDQWTEEK